MRSSTMSKTHTSQRVQDNFSKEITIFKTLRRHWDLIPMVAAVSAGCIGATSYTIYAALTKPDVRWNRSSELPPFERIDPTKKQKLLIISQEYKPIEELQKLRAEIGPYKD